jgi:hypothetical protein
MIAAAAIGFRWELKLDGPKGASATMELRAA